VKIYELMATKKTNKSMIDVSAADVYSRQPVDRYGTDVYMTQALYQ